MSNLHSAEKSGSHSNYYQNFPPILFLHGSKLFYNDKNISYWGIIKMDTPFFCVLFPFGVF